MRTLTKTAGSVLATMGVLALVLLVAPAVGMADDTSKCQLALAKQATKCPQTLTKELYGCKKDALSGTVPPTVASESELRARCDDECHFDPRLPCCEDSDCPGGTDCDRNDFCVRDVAVGCSTNADCPGDIAPDSCRTVLWASDHLGVSSVVELQARSWPKWGFVS